MGEDGALRGASINFDNDDDDDDDDNKDNNSKDQLNFILNHLLI